jgi:hypothetical protein
MEAVRPPGDIDLFGDAFTIATALVDAGYVRTGAREFCFAGDTREYSIQLWDSGREVLPGGVPPCLEYPETLKFERQEIQVASLADLLAMKKAIRRRNSQDRAKDQADSRVIIELLSRPHRLGVNLAD